MPPPSLHHAAARAETTSIEAKKLHDVHMGILAFQERGMGRLSIWYHVLLYLLDPERMIESIVDAFGLPIND